MEEGLEIIGRSCLIAGTRLPMKRRLIAVAPQTDRVLFLLIAAKPLGSASFLNSLWEPQP